MAIDTLAYVKALEGAGVDRRVAEAHLKAMQDGVLSDLVSKRDLAATEQRLDQRITSVETKLEQRIAGVELKLEAKIDKLEERIKGMAWQASVGILLGGLTIGGFLIRLLK